MNKKIMSVAGTFFLCASAAAAFAQSAAVQGQDWYQPLSAISYEFGSKFTSGYFAGRGGICLVALMALENFIAEQISLRLHTTWDAVGYAASLLVISAFCMKDISSLRALAILSNLAFLTYGIALSLEPIWILHGILLPLNCWRLKQAVLQKRHAGTA